MCYQKEYVHNLMHALIVETYLNLCALKFLILNGIFHKEESVVSQLVSQTIKIHQFIYY